MIHTHYKKEFNPYDKENYKDFSLSLKQTNKQTKSNNYKVLLNTAVKKEKTNLKTRQNKNKTNSGIVVNKKTADGLNNIFSTNSNYKTKQSTVNLENNINNIYYLDFNKKSFKQATFKQTITPDIKSFVFYSTQKQQKAQNLKHFSINFIIKPNIFYDTKNTQKQTDKNIMFIAKQNKIVFTKKEQPKQTFNTMYLLNRLIHKDNYKKYHHNFTDEYSRLLHKLIIYKLNNPVYSENNLFLIPFISFFDDIANLSTSDKVYTLSIGFKQITHKLIQNSEIDTFFKQAEDNNTRKVFLLKQSIIGGTVFVDVSEYAYTCGSYIKENERLIRVNELLDYLKKLNIRVPVKTPNKKCVIYSGHDLKLPLYQDLKINNEHKNTIFNEVANDLNPLRKYKNTKKKKSE